MKLTALASGGTTFAPSIRNLGQIHRGLPDVPMMALTATADKVTREDILKQLGLHNPYISVSSFDRPNLSLTVIRGFNGSEKTQSHPPILARTPRTSRHYILHVAQDNGERS